MNTYWLLFKVEHGRKRLLAVFCEELTATSILDLHERYKKAGDVSTYAVEKKIADFAEIAAMFDRA
jgi:hypothetical protein